MRILVVNAGSATVKLRVVEGDQVSSSLDLGPPDAGLDEQIGAFLDQAGPVDAVGHRVVHGGSLFSSATLIDDEMRVSLGQMSELAPLHNPPALAAIDATRRMLPNVPSVACFDTGFHSTLPSAASTYAVPSEWVTEWGLRRYGFHGLSCAWATRRADELMGVSDRPRRLVICHLGGGASVTAVTGGHSVDTTMGFTPLEGLVMATRSGDVDPGALLWVLNHGTSALQLQEALEHRSGLFGLSQGLSSDMRELLAARTGGDARAELAVAVYIHRLRAKVAAMAAAVGGPDAVIFTGGIGEHSPPIRSEACATLSWMGVTLDPAANDRVGGTDTDTDISLPGATVRVLVIHAREDLQIARECRHLLQLRAEDPAH